jgi:recombination protein RecR
LNYTLPLARLIEEFQRLPGVGPKSAQRLAFHILKQSTDDVRRFARALVDAREQVGYCQRCYNLSAQAICEICCQTGRKRETLCVVAEPRDLYALERTHEYKGLYHVLQGLISPLEGVGPQDLKIRELLNRLGPGNSQNFQSQAEETQRQEQNLGGSPSFENSSESHESQYATKPEQYSGTVSEYLNSAKDAFPPIQEVILALPPSIEGDTTSLYLARLLKPLAGMKLTRIAFGLPVGADLEYADNLTITRALQGRQLV